MMNANYISCSFDVTMCSNMIARFHLLCAIHQERMSLQVNLGLEDNEEPKKHEIEKEFRATHHESYDFSEVVKYTRDLN